jgi:hypothetical protein
MTEKLKKIRILEFFFQKLKFQGHKILSESQKNIKILNFFGHFSDLGGRGAAIRSQILKKP